MKKNGKTTLIPTTKVPLQEGIEVYIGDRRIATFEFEVVPAKRQKPAPKA
ncbi:hypothetical protein [Fischerella thermalis]|nr:hypothetical protein [Fischerella thermalis]